jgi:hypothetical protein
LGYARMKKAIIKSVSAQEAAYLDRTLS